MCHSSVSPLSWPSVDRPRPMPGHCASPVCVQGCPLPVGSVGSRPCRWTPGLWLPCALSHRLGAPLPVRPCAHLRTASLQPTPWGIMWQESRAQMGCFRMCMAVLRLPAAVFLPRGAIMPQPPVLSSICGGHVASEGPECPCSQAQGSWRGRMTPGPSVPPVLSSCRVFPLSSRLASALGELIFQSDMLLREEAGCRGHMWLTPRLPGVTHRSTQRLRGEGVGRAEGRASF